MAASPKVRHHWGVDSEYIYFGKKGEDDVVNIGFSDGHDNNFAYRKPEEAKQFLESKRLLRLFAFSLRPEFGTFAAWKLLGVDDPTKAVDLESQAVQRFTVQRSLSRKTLVLDVRPFYQPLSWKDPVNTEVIGLTRLENIGRFLSSYYNDPLLLKVKMDPEWFGKRKPETEEEWRQIDERVRIDARITSRAAEFLESVLLPRFIAKPNLNQYYSWGTITRQYFRFPQRYPRMGREVVIPQYHKMIHDMAEFAGRNEAFSIGATPPLYYSDVRSLYPLSVVASDALRIVDVEPLAQSDLNAITKPSDLHPYGWLYGAFESQDDLWGLPARTSQRNYYIANGTIVGLYHTLDLEASKAKIHELYWGLKPVFTNDRSLHEKYASLTLQRIEGRYADLLEKYGMKELVNDALGKLGQYRPQPSASSNFPAYSTGLAMSHKIMNHIFELAPKPIHYCDTDSIFIETKHEGTQFELNDQAGEFSVPVVLETKGYGDHPFIFRAKHYFLSTEGEGYAVHGVLNTMEFRDWLGIMRTLPDQAMLTRQIRGQIRARSAKAQELQFGRWLYEKQEASLERLNQIFDADDKRFRERYDSYNFVREGKWAGSRAWTASEFYSLKMRDEDCMVSLPGGKAYSHSFIEKWLQKYSKSPQVIGT